MRLCCEVVIEVSDEIAVGLFCGYNETVMDYNGDCYEIVMDVLSVIVLIMRSSLSFYQFKNKSFYQFVIHVIAKLL